MNPPASTISTFSGDWVTTASAVPSSSVSNRSTKAGRDYQNRTKVGQELKLEKKTGSASMLLSHRNVHSLFLDDQVPAYVSQGRSRARALQRLARHLAWNPQAVVAMPLFVRHHIHGRIEWRDTLVRHVFLPGDTTLSSDRHPSCCHVLRQGICSIHVLLLDGLAQLGTFRRAEDRRERVVVRGATEEHRRQPNDYGDRCEEDCNSVWYP